MKFQIAANTHVGEVRDHNEDNFFVCSNLTNDDWSFDKSIEYDLGLLGTVLIVADGMGGMNAGEVASEIAVETSKIEFSKKAKDVDLSSENSIDRFIKETILNAHSAILAHQKTHPETQGMGTTLIIGWVVNGTAHVGWCGDSRAYIFNPLLKSSGRAKSFQEEGLRVKENLVLVSKDHSFVQSLIDKGDLTDSQAFFHPESNIITQSLGQEGREVQPSLMSLPLHSGDKLILCSDGINAMLEDGEIAEICDANLVASETSNTLITQANEKGGHDNSTVTIFHAIQADVGLFDPLAQAIKLGPSQRKSKPFGYLKYIVLAILMGSTVASFLFTNKHETPQQTIILDQSLPTRVRQLKIGDTLYQENSKDRSAVELNIEQLDSISNIDTRDFKNVIERKFYVTIANFNQEPSGSLEIEKTEDTPQESIQTAAEVPLNQADLVPSAEPELLNKSENATHGMFQIRIYTTSSFPNFPPELLSIVDRNMLIVVPGPESKFYTYYGRCSSSRSEADSILKSVSFPSSIDPHIYEVLKCNMESVSSAETSTTSKPTNNNLDSQEEQPNAIKRLTPIEELKMPIQNSDEVDPKPDTMSPDPLESQIKLEDTVSNSKRTVPGDTSLNENIKTVESDAGGGTHIE